MVKKIIILLAAYFCISFITGIESVWRIDGRIYFVGQQLCEIILLIGLWLLCPIKTIRIIITSLIILNSFEAIDEWFNVNDKFRLSDYIVTILVLLWTSYRIIAQCKKNLK